MSKPTSINKQEVAHIANLANLPLSNTEAELYTSQLGETVTYVSMLEALDTTKIEPTNQVTGLVDVLAKDEPTPSYTQDVALKNAPSTKDGYFKVSAVLKE